MGGRALWWCRCRAPAAGEAQGHREHCTLSSAAGFYTVEALAHAPSKELAAVKGISEAKVNKFKEIGGWRRRWPV